MSINIQSMTGFARCEEHIENLHIIWEIRSVNHRHLDIHLRLPENVKSLESQCRASAAKQFSRGRIDANLQINYTLDNTQSQLNISALKQLKAQLHQVNSILPDLNSPSSLDILMSPGILQTAELDFEKLSANIIHVFQKALDELSNTRKNEGEKLKQMLLTRLAHCQDITNKLNGNIEQINAQVMANYKSRLSQLDDNVDEQRIAQEFAIMLTKADVSEELDRLLAHYEQINSLLTQKGGAVGRRLDFLMQELNREANTLGSKAHEITLTNCAVELKVLIDQMREQIQNLE